MSENESMDLVLNQNPSIEVPGVGTLDASFLSINEDHLGEDLDKQAAYYAFWGVAEAEAERDHAEAKVRLGVVKARVRREVKSAYPKATVPDLAALIDEHDDVLNATALLIDAKYRLDLVKSIRYALQQKKDMLSSKVGLQRTEMEVHMRDTSAKLIKGEN
jgi:hypothetical protein